MRREEVAMIIAGICVVIGTVLMLIGIITSEIDIKKIQSMGFYDSIDN